MSAPETSLILNQIQPNLPGPELILLSSTLSPSTFLQILPHTASKFPLTTKKDSRNLRSNNSNKDKLCTNFQGEALIPINDQVGNQKKKRDENVIINMLVWNRDDLKEELGEYFEEFKLKIECINFYLPPFIS